MAAGDDMACLCSRDRTIAAEFSWIGGDFWGLQSTPWAGAGLMKVLPGPSRRPAALRGELHAAWARPGMRCNLAAHGALQQSNKMLLPAVPGISYD